MRMRVIMAGCVLTASLLGARGVPTGLNLISFIPRNVHIANAMDYKPFSQEVHNKRVHSYVNRSVSVGKSIFGVYSGFAPESATGADYVTLYVSGYSGPCGNASLKGRGAAVRAALQVAAYGGIHGPCVTFDFPTDTFRRFNFGQKSDQDCVRRALAATMRAYPNKRIVLYGDCRGATVTLQFLAGLLKNDDQGLLQSIAGIVLIAPSDSLRAVAKQVARSRFGSPAWLGHGLHGLFRLVFRNYDQSAPAVTTMLNAVGDKTLKQKICIVGIERDGLATYENIEKMVAELRRIGCDVIFHTISDHAIKHARHLRDQGCVKALKSFYQTL